MQGFALDCFSFVISIFRETKCSSIIAMIESVIVWLVLFSKFDRMMHMRKGTKNGPHMKCYELHILAQALVVLDFGIA